MCQLRRAYYDFCGHTAFSIDYCTQAHMDGYYLIPCKDGQVVPTTKKDVHCLEECCDEALGPNICAFKQRFRALEKGEPHKVDEMNAGKITPQTMDDYKRTRREAGEKVDDLIERSLWPGCNKACVRHHKNQRLKPDNCLYRGDFREYGRVVRIYEHHRWAMLKELIGKSNPQILREWVPGIKVDEVIADQSTTRTNPAGQDSAGSAASSQSAANLAGYNLWVVQ